MTILAYIEQEQMHWKKAKVSIFDGSSSNGTYYMIPNSDDSFNEYF